MKRVAIYVRVSTQEQANEGYSIGEQTARLSKYCEAHNWLQCRVYTDPGYSGAKLERPALQQLIKDIDKDIFDTVLVYKLDRLSRSQKNTMYLIEDVFLKNHVDFISMNENFDTSTPFGRAMIGILSVFSQLERDQITERFIMGRVGRAKSGLYSGGSQPPIGYDYIDSRLIPNEYESLQVKKIFELFLHGLDGEDMSYIAICNYMAAHYKNKYSSWSAPNEIKQVLQNSVYMGLVKFQGKYYDGVHEPIISKEDFEAAQAAIVRRSETFANTIRKREGQVNLLTGICFCGRCNRRFAIKSMNTKRGAKEYTYRYYRCNSGREKNMSGPRCKNKSYRQDELETIILSEIQKLFFDPSQIEAIASSAATDPSSETSVLQKRIAELDAQASRVLDLYQLGTVTLDAIGPRLDKIKAEKYAIEKEIDSMQIKKPRLSAEAARTELATFEEVLTDGSDSDRQRLVRSLIDHIVIDGDDITIYWAFCC